MSRVKASSRVDDLPDEPAAFETSPLYTIRTMFDCATCTVPMLGESTVYIPFSMLWISPSMRLPSLSSIVGDASTPEARPSNAAAKQALSKIFIGATLGHCLDMHPTPSEGMERQSAFRRVDVPRLAPAAPRESTDRRSGSSHGEPQDRDKAR